MQIFLVPGGWERLPHLSQIEVQEFVSLLWLSRSLWAFLLILNMKLRDGLTVLLSYLKGNLWKGESFLNIHTMAEMNQYLLEYGILSVICFFVLSLVEILLKSCMDEL